jgi:L-alanine-DL-glutamate epimerase-like enolase superfamily enzyme
MTKPTDVRVLSVASTTELIKYRSPIKFGGRVVVDAMLLNVTLEMETRDGKRGQGFGSMPMGNVWAWPTDAISTEQTQAAMLEFARRLEKDVAAYKGIAHPLDITVDWGKKYQSIADEVVAAMKLPQPMPKLAQLVAASPFEAAVHDAQGKALGVNSYNLLGPEFVSQDIAAYLEPAFVGEYLDRYTSREPKAKMPLYHLVGALDPLTASDVATRIEDGLPNTLGEWILADGLTHLKIKLNGDNLKWDVDRVVAVNRVAEETQRMLGVSTWFYSCDFNERCANVEYLLDFLAKVKELAPTALGRLQYIEQPTHRDLKAHPENRMHRAAAIKPVVIDESLIDLESFHLAREQGYSGVALKACKGHTEALLMGAAAQKYNMFLCVQDLSCPGYSFLHSSSLAARIPTIAGIEGNSRQYCPSGNVAWKERFPTMFTISDGTVGTSVLTGPGLGF